MTIELLTRPAPYTPTYTWAGKPASYPAGQRVRISDMGAKGSFWFYDGTLWQPDGGSQTLANVTTSVTGISNVEAVNWQYQLPAAALQVGFTLIGDVMMSKSGTTDTGSIKARLGTAGTTGDTLLFNVQIMSAANQQGAGHFELRLESATSILPMPSQASGILGYGSNNNAAPSAVTISNVSNSLFFSLCGLSGGASNTLSILRADLRIAGKYS